MKRERKRILWLAVILAAALLLTLPCAALADPPDEQCPSPFSSDGHHDWQLWDQQDPTCEQAGYTTWICTDCNKKYREDYDAAGHSWGEWKDRQAATCTGTGSQYRECSRCGMIDSREVAALGHDAETIPGTAATCTETGLTEGSRCKRCGTVLTAQQTIPAKGHSPVSVPGKEATCTEAGLTEGSNCSVCGAVLTAQQTIPAKGHSPVSIPGKAATCTEAGQTEGSYCAVCGAVLAAQQAVPAKGHSPVSIPGKEATCTEAGQTEGSYCAVCGAVLAAQQAVPALGHAWDNGVTTTPSGFLEAGVKTYTCQRCGATKTEEVPVQNTMMSGHSIMDLLRNGHTGETSDEDPLRIVTQPVGGMISHDGGSMELSVEVEGGKAPYTYEWRRRYSHLWIVPFYAIFGANDSTCNADLGNNLYYCRVTDDAGNKVTSDSVLVSYSVYFKLQPQDANLYGKDSVTLTCKAAGGTPFEGGDGDGYSYSWLGPDGSLLDNPITNEAGNVLTVSEPGEYNCWVMDNEGGEAYSELAWVYSSEENLNPIITLQPESVTLGYRQNNQYDVELTCLATGYDGDDSNLIYSWQKKGTGTGDSWGSGWGNGQVLSISGSSNEVSGIYRCFVIDLRTGESEYSEEVKAQVEMNCSIISYEFFNHRDVRVTYKIEGGKGPYRVNIYKYQATTLDYHDTTDYQSEWLYDDFRTVNTEGEGITNICDVLYPYPVYRDGAIIIRWDYSAIYFEVIDDLGNICESNQVLCKW